MRAMMNPVQNGNALYVTCVSSISNAILQANLNSVAGVIATLWIDYNQKGLVGDLYMIPADVMPAAAPYLGVATKQAFKDLYTQQMVGGSKPIRSIYDALLASAPKGKCPYCGYGQAKTLDHYLPKASFPQFAVYPSNLVPACTDCNVGKRSAVAINKQSQCIHPYYDAHLVADQWLFAEVREENPLTLRYYALPPANWNPVDRARIQAHFIDFDLEKRLAIEATDELASIRDTILRHYAEGGVLQIKEALIAEAESRRKSHRNSWQTALYQALGKSDWYCNGGYNFV